MKTLTCYLVFVTLLSFLATTLGETVLWDTCDDDDEDETPSCVVNSVNVVPCKEAASGEPCRVQKEHNASISFIYTPNFSATTPHARAYWASSFADLPLLGMDTNACHSTPCPIVAGRQQTYTYSLAIDKAWGPRLYDIKWKLWNEEEKLCCFRFQIHLHD